MPALLDGATRISRKRKRNNVEQTKPGSPETNGHDEILLLENQILESRRHFNSITTLLNYVNEQEPQDTKDAKSVLAAIALCRVFCRLLAAGNMSRSRETSKNEALIVQWLMERYQEYKSALLSMLALETSDRSTTAMTLLMRLIKEEAVQLKLSEEAIWAKGLFTKLLRTLVNVRAIDDARAAFVDNYLLKYDDIRYHTFTQLLDIASGEISTTSLDVMILFLSAVESVPAKREDIKDFFVNPPTKIKHSLYSLIAHKGRAQEAWMAVLGHGLSKPQRRTALELMSRRIAPWFLKVELLMDFLTDSFNVGGSTSLMALSGLFYLIREKNLDYPQFYLKLYSLLDSDILHSKHRSHFFRLLDTFLASTHLPAALVASFIKRLSRLTLHAPPSGVVSVVPWIYNLLKSHPVCTFMIHRKLRPGVEASTCNEDGREDPFRMGESDPMETHALKSSLWEVQMLQSHYHPNVASIAKIISEQFTKQSYNLEDFLDHSYGSLLDAELQKDVKKPHEIEYGIPKKIFFKHDADSGCQDSVLVQLWEFK